MTYTPNPNCSPQIKVEIGANRFFVGEGLSIQRSRIPGSSSASFSLTLPSTAQSPSDYTLALVLGLNGVKRFGGLYKQQSVEYLENGTQKRYNCKLEDFISFTRFLPIFNYKRSDTFMGHLQRLTQLGGASSPERTLNLIEPTIISTATTPDPDSDFTPPDIPETFEFNFVQGTLADAYNQIGALMGYSWEIVASTWNSIGLLTSGFISIVRFRRNGIRGNPAPHPIIYAPTNSNVICLTDRFYSKLDLTVNFPEISSVLALGLNGEERAADPSFPSSIPDTTPYTLTPIASMTDAEIDYSYPDNALTITGVRITTI